MQKAIMSYNQTYQGQWNFAVLHDCLVSVNDGLNLLDDTLYTSNNNMLLNVFTSYIDESRCFLDPCYQKQLPNMDAFFQTTLLEMVSLALKLQTICRQVNLLN